MYTYRVNPNLFRIVPGFVRSLWWSCWSNSQRYLPPVVSPPAVSTP